MKYRCCWLAAPIQVLFLFTSLRSHLIPGQLSSAQLSSALSTSITPRSSQFSQ